MGLTAGTWTFFPFIGGGHPCDGHEQGSDEGVRRTVGHRRGRGDHRPNHRRRGYVVLRRELPLDPRGGWLVRRTATSRRRTIRGPSARGVEVRLERRAQEPGGARAALVAPNPAAPPGGPAGMAASGGKGREVGR